MGLGTALVDEARAVRMTSTGRKVEGSTLTLELPGPWFRVRLDAEGSQRNEQPEGTGRQRVTRTASALWALKDRDGQLVDVRSTDKLEIRASGGAPDGLYRVMGEPEPVRKKRRVIGFTVQVQRIIDQDADWVPHAARWGAG